MKLKILHTTAELFPYIKAGGLSDMLASLSISQAQKHDVSIALPLIKSIKPEIQYTGRTFPCILPEHNYHSDACFLLKNSRFLEAEDQGRKLYFFDSPLFRDVYTIYMNSDEHFRFAVFSYACYSLALQLNVDVINAHDWHTAIVSVLSRVLPQKKPTVFTIHNLAYQGDHPDYMCGFLRIDPFYLDLRDFYHLGKINYMKAGLSMCNEITTVSEGYRNEILHEPAGKFLAWLLNERQANLTGILNGIDDEVWNPSLDKRIYVNYNSRSIKKGKMDNKIGLYKEYGLNVDPERPLVGLIGRLTYQKGFNTFLSSFYHRWNLPFYYFVLGSGDPELEHHLFHESHYSSGRIYFYKGFDETLAHKIEAAADFFLMPSLFEPCGLNQMYSQVYGTIPIVSRVGGLKDSVKESFDLNEMTGFVFEPGEDHSLNYALDRANGLYYNKPAFDTVRKQILKMDHSWKKGRLEYDKVYKKAISQLK